MNGNELRFARQKRRLTQWGIKALCGIHPTRLSLIENGHVQPREDELATLRKVLGLDK